MAQIVFFFINQNHLIISSFCVVIKNINCTKYIQTYYLEFFYFLILWYTNSRNNMGFSSSSFKANHPVNQMQWLDWSYPSKRKAGPTREKGQKKKCHMLARVGTGKHSHRRRRSRESNFTIIDLFRSYSKLNCRPVNWR